MVPGGRRDAAGGVEAPESTYLYLGALRARARAGARRCSGAAWGPPGRAGRPLRRAGCALRRRGAGRDPLRSAPASSSPSWGHGGSRGGGSNRHGSAAAAAAAKEEAAAAAAAQLRRARQARRSPHGRTRTAGGARARSSRRRTRGGAGALPGKVKLEPEAARGRWGPEERRPAPRCAQP